MIDRENVIYNIERCISHVPDACRDCSKYGTWDAMVCMEELLSDALELLKEQKLATDINAHNKWISVKDRLPEQVKTVLVARKYVQPGHKEMRYVETAELIGTSWVSIEDEYKMHRQFHTLPYAWMPLPKPPKE